MSSCGSLPLLRLPACRVRLTELPLPEPLRCSSLTDVSDHPLYRKGGCFWFTCNRGCENREDFLSHLLEAHNSAYRAAVHIKAQKKIVDFESQRLKAMRWHYAELYRQLVSPNGLAPPSPPPSPPPRPPSPSPPAQSVTATPEDSLENSAPEPAPQQPLPTTAPFTTTTKKSRRSKASEKTPATIQLESEPTNDATAAPLSITETAYTTRRARGAKTAKESSAPYQLQSELNNSAAAPVSPQLMTAATSSIPKKKSRRVKAAEEIIARNQHESVVTNGVAALPSSSSRLSIAAPPTTTRKSRRSKVVEESLAPYQPEYKPIAYDATPPLHSPPTTATPIGAKRSRRSKTVEKNSLPYQQESAAHPATTHRFPRRDNDVANISNHSNRMETGIEKFDDVKATGSSSTTVRNRTTRYYGDFNSADVLVNQLQMLAVSNSSSWTGNSAKESNSVRPNGSLAKRSADITGRHTKSRPDKYRSDSSESEFDERQSPIRSSGKRQTRGRSKLAPQLPVRERLLRQSKLKSRVEFYAPSSSGSSRGGGEAAFDRIDGLDSDFEPSSPVMPNSQTELGQQYKCLRPENGIQNESDAIPKLVIKIVSNARADSPTLPESNSKETRSNRRSLRPRPPPRSARRSPSPSGSWEVWPLANSDSEQSNYEPSDSAKPPSKIKNSPRSNKLVVESCGYSSGSGSDYIPSDLSDPEQLDEDNSAAKKVADECKKKKWVKDSVSSLKKRRTRKKAKVDND